MRVTFKNVLRDRPIVLTEHEITSLSRVVGRDVLPELRSLCGERFDAATLGKLIRVLEATLRRQRQHIGSSDCWCSPSVEYKDPDTGVAVWVHKQVQ